MLHEELVRFDEEIKFLGDYRRVIYDLDVSNELERRTAFFLVESLVFRLYRAQERLVRALFLETCVTQKTFLGEDVFSRIRCADWDQAEEILKSNNKFLDWGNPQSTNSRASLVFDRGYPLNDVLAPVHSALIDLCRIRNFIAHDSKEARAGFDKAVRTYLPTTNKSIMFAGELLLSRKAPKDSYVVTKILNKVGSLSSIYRGL